MICLVLAAGYATRLYPLTENFPKPLLHVGEKTILDWLLDDISTAVSQEGTPIISSYMVVTNHKFAGVFEQWAALKKLPIVIADDGTLTNESRLGAVRDIQFAVERFRIKDDLLVIAGDNVLDFSLTHFIDYARRKNAACVMRYDEPDVQKLRKTGVAEVADDDRIIRMEEKPAVPFSHWCTPPFYFYPRLALPLIDKAIQSGCGTDAPGSFIAWLSSQIPVYAMLMPGRRFDIGNLESYQSVQCNYKGIIE